MGRKDEENMFDNLIKLNTQLFELFEVVEKNDTSSEYNDKKNILIQTLKTLIETNKSELMASQIFYPIMQCADIFFLNVDICSLGIDQKKVNMLAIEYCDKIKRRFKPIILSHHMLMGLDGSDKMSKSNPDNTIFMDDTPNEIKKKINKAFCEPLNVTKNPLLDWIHHLVLPIEHNITIKTLNEQNDEVEIMYDNIEQIKINYSDGKIHPVNLKMSMIKIITNMLAPIQEKYNTM